MGRSKRRGGRWLPAAAAALVLGAGMLASSAGGCNRFEDTYVNYTTVSGSGGGGTGGGSGQGGMGPVTAEEFFEQNVKPGLIEGCAGADCHSSGTKAFILSGTEYAAITTYETALGIPLLVDPPELSPLITHPDSGEHTGPTWAGREALRDVILQWLRQEAENLEPIQILQIGPITPAGLTIIPLDSVGPEFAGSRLSFYATAIGDPVTVLELSNIAIWPPNNLGIRATNPTFFVLPNDGPAAANTAFHGEPHVFVAPGNVQLGTGNLVLTNWEQGAQLVIAFEGLDILFADPDGSVYDPCNRDDLFEEGVEALPINSASNQPNGLLYCTDQCHGGNNGSAPTDKLDLSNLLSDSPNYPFMCAKVRPFIVPTNVDDSAIMALTDPLGAAVHPFSFGGNSSSHNAFKNAMSAWINNEGVTER